MPLVDVEFDLGFLCYRIVEADRTEFFLVGSLVGSSGSGATGLPRPEFDPRCPESADFVNSLLNNLMSPAKEGSAKATNAPIHKADNAICFFILNHPYW